VLISSHRKLLSSKATVVNVAEKSGHDLDRREWAAIRPMLPNKARGVRRVDNRRWVLRSGAPWRDLPEPMHHNHLLQPFRPVAKGGSVAADHGRTCRS
jgi:transposase